MAAKKKNPVGAPRTVSFSPKEMIALGEEMIDWVKKNPAILHLSEWYTIEKRFTYNQWKTFIQCKEFFPYYEQALKIVGRKYLDKSSNVRDSISHRWLRIYFGDLRQTEDEDAKFNAALKAQENQTISDVESNKLNAFIEAINERQSSARNISDSKSNADNKS